MMEVILTDEVVKLGSKGDVVRVASGYARNYLYPKQLAIPATASNKKQIDQMRSAADREAEKLRGGAEKMAEVLSGLTVRIEARAGETDQLFGSVTSRDIVDELLKLGHELDRHKIVLDQPIRMLGKHSVKVHLHRDIDLSLTVLVFAEGRDQETEDSDNLSDAISLDSSKENNLSEASEEEAVAESIEVIASPEEVAGDSKTNLSMTESDTDQVEE